MERSKETGISLEYAFCFFNNILCLGEMDISSVMGFTGFGKPQKAARKFDLDAIFEKTKREAKTIISHDDSSM